MSSPARATQRRVLIHQRPPIWLAGLALAVPALFGYLGAERVKDGIATDLTNRTTEKLVRAGINNVAIAVDGRDLRLSVPAGVDPDQAKSLAHSVAGVRSVSVQSDGAQSDGGSR